MCIHRANMIVMSLWVAGDRVTQGKDCFGAFMQWGLPKEVLRDVWNLVAKGQGQLDAKQFISCVYLMDSVKKVYCLLAGTCIHVLCQHALSMCALINVS